MLTDYTATLHPAKRNPKVNSKISNINNLHFLVLKAVHWLPIARLFNTTKQDRAINSNGPKFIQAKSAVNPGT